MRTLLAILALVTALALAACGDDGEDDATTSGAEEAAATDDASAPESAAEGDEPDEAKPEKQRKRKPKRKPGTKITIASSPVGDAVFDGDNQAIYIFDKETTSESECYGECAAAWPPVLTKGKPAASGAAKQGRLGTTKRDDGTIQVTYAGQPLYYYAHEAPGELRCHNVPGFGGLWLAIDANGQAFG